MLGAGLIRCRDEDVVATRCTRTRRRISKNQANLECSRARGTDPSKHLTHEAASPALLSRPVLPLIRANQNVGEHKGTRLLYVMKCDECPFCSPLAQD